jgi:hypothetical protein
MLAFLAVLAAQASDPAPFLCVCRRDAPAAEIVFRGVAIDAEMVATDGGGVAERQATVFRVTAPVKGAAATPMKIWHETTHARCGVAFAYGATYVVKARIKKGVVETDACLQPEAAIPAPELE